MPTHAAKAHLVFAHGAGAAMDHPWMVAMDDALQAVGIAATRFNFPFMQGPKRRAPDRAPVLVAAVRAQVEQVSRRRLEMPLLAGGKSLGGRMTAYAQAEAPLPGVRGLVFFGFPLHPAGKPGTTRAEPLADIAIPMLFLQGTRDALADSELMRGVCKGLGKRATLVEIPEANHGFAVPKRSGKTDADVRAFMANALQRWVASHVDTDTSVE